MSAAAVGRRRDTSLKGPARTRVVGCSFPLSSPDCPTPQLLYLKASCQEGHRPGPCPDLQAAQGAPSMEK